MSPAQNETANPDPDLPEPPAVFVYGTLMAEELLSGLFSHSADRTHHPPSYTRKPAVLHGYRRVPVRYAAYPAIIPGMPSDQVDGYMISPISLDQWELLDEFEGDQYRREMVRVVLPESAEQVPAQAYVWGESPEWLKLDEKWDYSHFRESQLGAWIGAG